MALGTETEARFILTGQNKTAPAFAAVGQGMQDLNKRADSLGRTFRGLGGLAAGAGLGRLVMGAISAGEVGWF